MREPRVTLVTPPGGPVRPEGLLWEHECNFQDLDGSTYHRQLLPIDDSQGWRVEAADPLTVSPSILCGSCNVHGFWRQGQWVPA